MATPVAKVSATAVHRIALKERDRIPVRASLERRLKRRRHRQGIRLLVERRLCDVNYRAS
jgi:hypothetical protein